MESSIIHDKVTFNSLRTRLIELVNARIDGGHVSERGLSRILGLSQSQVHNVLKGARKLQPELADRLMVKFSLTILDLLENGELDLSAGVEIRKQPGRAKAIATKVKSA